VHGIDFLVDSARRLCRGAEKLDRHNTERLRIHVAELIEDVANLRRIDGNQLGQIDKQLRVVAATLRHVHAHAERATFRRWAPRPMHRETSAVETADKGAKLEPMPVGLILAVVLDAGIDGMLIGLASSVAVSSGVFMSIATIFEMGFLGYSFACSVVPACRSKVTAVAVLATPPLVMLAASVTAAEFSANVEKTPVFSGLVAFALAAVLFLVVQELLEEANEKEGSEEWHVSCMLYIGLLVSIGFELAF
jgi:zinc transporter ZupT